MDSSCHNTWLNQHCYTIFSCHPTICCNLQLQPTHNRRTMINSINSIHSKLFTHLWSFNSCTSSSISIIMSYGAQQFCAYETVEMENHHHRTSPFCYLIYCRIQCVSIHAIKIKLEIQLEHWSFFKRSFWRIEINSSWNYSILLLGIN